jgi:hypothetical protein
MQLVDRYRSRAIRENPIVAEFQCFVATPDFSRGGPWLFSPQSAANLRKRPTPELR